jgi:hypothetical protein
MRKGQHREERKCEKDSIAKNGNAKKDSIAKERKCEKDNIVKNERKRRE